MKNILIISASPRRNGNSDLLCREFERGALEAGNKVEYVNLCDHKFSYCLGCYACAKLGKCFQNDGYNELFEKVLKADVLVMATPVYFYSMDGQLKVFIDRTVQRYTEIRSDIYIFITAWDPDASHLESTLEAIRGFSRDCLEDCPEKGVILAGGFTEKGSIKGSRYMKEAYEMGLKA